MAGAGGRPLHPWPMPAARMAGAVQDTMACAGQSPPLFETCRKGMQMDLDCSRDSGADSGWLLQLVNSLPAAPTHRDVLLDAGSSC